MKFIRTFLTAYLVLLLMAQPSSPAFSGEAVSKAGLPSETWKWIWSDEFEKDGRPDPRNWSYETGFVRNRELQWYQPQNAWCEKGLLIIESRRERKQNPPSAARTAAIHPGRIFRPDLRWITFGSTRSDLPNY